jgi:hypothetical protein
VEARLRTARVAADRGPPPRARAGRGTRPPRPRRGPRRPRRAPGLPLRARRGPRSPAAKPPPGGPRPRSRPRARGRYGARAVPRCDSQARGDEAPMKRAGGRVTPRSFGWSMVDTPTRPRSSRRARFGRATQGGDPAVRPSLPHRGVGRGGRQEARPVLELRGDRSRADAAGAVRALRGQAPRLAETGA